MPNITCPSCGEKGKIPPTMIGKRIKCAKCGNAFLVAPPAPKVAASPPETAAVATPTPSVARVGTGDEIQVDGLDASAWETTPVASIDHEHEHDDEHHEHDPKFTPHEPSSVKQYKF